MPQAWIAQFFVWEVWERLFEVLGRVRDIGWGCRAGGARREWLRRAWLAAACLYRRCSGTAARVGTVRTQKVQNMQKRL